MQSIVLIQFQTRELADVVREVRQSSCGFKGDPSRGFIPCPLYQESVIFSASTPNVTWWKWRGINRIIVCKKPMRQDAVDGELETVRFGHGFDALDCRDKGCIEEFTLKIRDNGQFVVVRVAQLDTTSFEQLDDVQRSKLTRRQLVVREI